MRQLVFFGTYTEAIKFGTGEIFQGKGEGIYVYDFDPSSGVIEPVGKTTGVKNPSYLAFDPTGRFLYAVNELKSFEGRASGAISAFALDRQTGRLKLLNNKATGGTDPCHVILDKNGRFALVANFMSGNVGVFPILPDGSLADPSDLIQHQGSSVDPIRQTEAHAHSVVLDAANRFAFVPDLGIDKLMIYRFDSSSGKLTVHEEPWFETKRGAGPRGFVFHPSERYAYLINELDSTLVALEYDGERGTLKEIQTVPALPEDFQGESTCADVHVDPSGAFLYASNRGHDSIVIYEIDGNTGRLCCVGYESTQGSTPRNFAIDPSGAFLLAANQNTDNVVTFRIDPRSGKLAATGQITNVPTPVCVKFLQVEG